jgi:hypothetical protein
MPDTSAFADNGSMSANRPEFRSRPIASASYAKAPTPGKIHPPQFRLLRKLLMRLAAERSMLTVEPDTADAVAPQSSGLAHVPFALRHGYGGSD